MLVLTHTMSQIDNHILHIWDILLGVNPAQFYLLMQVEYLQFLD